MATLHATREGAASASRPWSSALLVLLLGGLLLLAPASWAGEPARPDVAAPPEDLPASSAGAEWVPATTPPGGGPVPPPLIDLLGTWNAEGPGPAINGQVEGIGGVAPAGPNPVVGAVHDVAPHPTNGDILYVGTVNGGIWRTTNASALNPTWTSLTDTLPSLSIGALEFDPTDPSSNTLLAGIGRFSAIAQLGGIDNGLLRTTNGGTSWTQITDPLLVGETFTGVAARGNVLVACANYFTGGGGLWRSTDTGATWTTISGGAGTGLPNGWITDMVADPGSLTRLYVVVGFQGVYRSNDTGATWTKVSNAAVDAALSDPNINNAEMAVAPPTAAPNPGRLYLMVMWTGQPRFIAYADPGPVAWTQMDIPLTPEPAIVGVITNASNTTPITITTGVPHGLPNGAGVQITNVTGNTAANGIWARITVPNIIGPTTFTINGSSGNGAYTGGGNYLKLHGLNPKPKPGGQGSIHASIAADPGNSNLVYIGGDRQDPPWPNFVGANDYTGRLFRGDASVAANPNVVPSPQWSPLTHVDTGVFNSAPHADSRDMEFTATGILIEGDDGGIYRRALPAAPGGTWTSLCNNLQVTEHHDAAYDTISDIILTGNQDVGTLYQTATGNTLWTSWIAADGGDVETGPSPVTAGESDRWTSIQYLGGLNVSIWNAANANTAWVYPALTLLNPGFPGDTIAAQFYTPLALNVNDQNRMILGGSNGVFETLDRGGTISRISNHGINDSGAYDAVEYGGTSGGGANNDVLYYGAGATVWLRTAAPPTAPAATAYAGGTVRDIALNPNDWQGAYVVDANQVFETLDGGLTWTDITGDLFTVHSPLALHSVEYIPDTVSDGIAVGTNNGVYVTRLNSIGTWARLGSGIPNAPVYTLIYDIPDDLLVAGTLGRGSWTLPNVTAAVDNTPPTVNLTLQRRILWPARGAWVNPGLVQNISDNFDPLNTLTVTTTVTSDEAHGPPPFTPDGQLLGSTYLLRADRDIRQNGRVYLISTSATDTSGNTGYGCATIVVPRVLTVGYLTSVMMQATSAETFCLANSGAAPGTFSPIIP